MEINDLELFKTSLIRPTTLSKYIILSNYEMDLNETEILNIATMFIEYGLNYGIRGDVVFIYVLYYNNGICNKPNFLPICESESIQDAILDIFEYIKSINIGEIPFNTVDESEPNITIGDLINILQSPGYNTNKYVNILEARQYNDTYLQRFIRLYYLIYEFEKIILNDAGHVIKPIRYSDLKRIKKLPILNNSNKIDIKSKLILYNDEEDITIAILLSQKYNCPFTKGAKADFEENFDIIDVKDI